MNVTVNICVIFISYGKWSIIARSFDKYLLFQEIARWSLKVTVHFTSPPAVYEGSSFFTSSLTFGIFSPLILAILLGFSGGSDGKASACNAEDQGSIPGSGRSLDKEMATHSRQPTPVSLPGESHGRRSLGGYSPRGSQRVGHD